jgi:hypothetical protein
MVLNDMKSEFMFKLKKLSKYAIKLQIEEHNITLLDLIFILKISY